MSSSTFTAYSGVSGGTTLTLNAYYSTSKTDAIRYNVDGTQTGSQTVTEYWQCRKAVTKTVVGDGCKNAKQTWSELEKKRLRNPGPQKVGPNKTPLQPRRNPAENRPGAPWPKNELKTLHSTPGKNGNKNRPAVLRG